MDRPTPTPSLGDSKAPGCLHSKLSEEYVTSTLGPQNAQWCPDKIIMGKSSSQNSYREDLPSP